jgi:hypothetical protein
MGDAEGAERIDDGVHDGGKSADIAGLAGAFYAQRGEPARRLPKLPFIFATYQALTMVATSAASDTSPEAASQMPPSPSMIRLVSRAA